MVIIASDPDLLTLTRSDSIAAMPDPSFRAGEIAIAPPAVFVVIQAPIPNEDYSEWVYMVLGKNGGYQYFSEGNLIKYNYA